MEAATLARPYARAAFDLAREQQALEAWSAHLALAAAVAADPRVAGLHNDPRVEPDRLARLYRPEGVADDASFARFLAVLAENGRLALLPEVAWQFDALRREAEHTVQVQLTCAAEPEADQVQQLAAALQARFGREVQIKTAVDPAILGGAVVDVDGEVIDGSVRARLQQLQTALTI